MSDEKTRILSILFENYSPGCKNRMSNTAEKIIKSAFQGDVGTLSLQELNYAVSRAIHHIVDYIELTDPEINLEVALRLATQFVIKATGFEKFWKQMETAGLVSIDDYSEWI